ncbi:MAG TPA: lipopolysaccharide transport periplasmic protein LptA [Steroidobacteraceae bacterium]|nr:lipopolysaccharide transport periplasmic protein LptA [Steroidobacteraceae bacterium]
MAPICPKLGALLGACAMAALADAAPAASAGQLPDFSGLPVQLEAAGGSEVDFQTREVVLKKVVISQGTMRISAERARATGLDFANSRWNFEGNVHIDAEQRGNLHSDQAVVEFKDNHIARATITGKPAEFEQKRANDQIARGHADEILYDVNDGTVRLTNDAWLSDGQNEISGPVLVYNIREQRVQAAAGPDDAAGSEQRVHISIAPHPGAGGKSEAPKPDGAKPEAVRPPSAPEATPKS